MGIFLAKIASEKNALDMYENEYLYFNTFLKFRDDKLDLSGRNDPREGNLRTEQVKNLEITLPTGKTLDFSRDFTSFSAQLNENALEYPYNICSLYMVYFDQNFKFNQIDDRIYNLGEKTILIHQTKEFIEILRSSISKKELNFKAKSVTYYDYKHHNGDLTLYHKEKSFEYQQEYRVLIESKGTESMKISFPGLKEISTLINTKDLKTIRINPLDESNRNPEIDFKQ